MISIIVSSVNPEQNKIFRSNIEQTIGVDYELLIHDNRQTGWGLCKLYNHYAARSRYDILCFFHEDIIFHTKGWGEQITAFFASHPKAGVVGFAGSTLQTEHMSGWSGRSNTNRINVTQHFPDGEVRELHVNPFHDDFSPAAPMDGLALISSRKVWSEHPFDEELFRRFHLYDLDFTMQVAQHYTNYVCHTISVEHFSSGSYDQEWFDESEKFVDKWREHLPFSVHPYSRRFINQCRHFDAYKAIRSRLKYAPGSFNTGGGLFKQFISVSTFPYKFKLMRHIISTGMGRVGRYLHPHFIYTKIK